jgi:transcriptional regulator with XRE-family HTH domain
MREDSGATQRELSAAAGIDHGFLSLIERGLREPSITALTAIASALGADASIRLFPGAGPRLRDPIQARIGEELLRILHPRWDRMLEVPVVRPARGFIDVVVLDRPPTLAICTEIQSEMRRIEQLIRWANEKALALPSAPFWDRMGETPSIERLLVVRSTRSNREVATRFSETLRVAYPGRSGDAYRALATANSPWPGPTILWADLRGDDATILDRPPRGVAVGR